MPPEAYDAAVARTPDACPLHALGDHRAGHQLLLRPPPAPHPAAAGAAGDGGPGGGCGVGGWGGGWGTGEGAECSVAAAARAPPASPGGAALRRLAAAVEGLTRRAAALTL